MKVKINVDPSLEEEYACLYVKEKSDAIDRISRIIEEIDHTIKVTDQDGKTVIMSVSEIVSVHAEKKWCRIYTNDRNYGCKMRLFEIEEYLGEGFLRVSKSIILNKKEIKSVEAVFHGMLLIQMKNGTKEYASRAFSPCVRRALAVIIAIIAAGLISVTSVYAYKYHFFEKVETFFEDSVLFRYHLSEKSEEDDKFEILKPNSIPEGFVMTDETEGGLLYSVKYEDGEGNQILWDQILITDATSIVYDTEYDWEKTVDIDGDELVIYGYEDGFTMSYFETGRYVISIYADNLTVNQIINIVRRK